MRTIIAVFFALSLLQPVYAAENNTSSEEDIVSYEPQFKYTGANNATEEDEMPPDITKLRINNEFWYIILLSLLCIISLTIVLNFLKSRDPSAKDIVNATGLTLIIFGTIILVLVVSTSEQLTAAIGILGAIAGYLFRSVQSDREEKQLPGGNK